MRASLYGMIWVATGLGGLSVAGLLWWLRRTFLVVTVHGASMLPTYRQGDRVLIRRRSLTGVRSGDVVVLNGSADDIVTVHDEQWIIKRAVAVPGDPVHDGYLPAEHQDTVVPPGALVLLGDNPDMSYDSRLHGYYHAGQLLGVVLRPMRAS